METLGVIVKWVTSFFKKNWTIADYPVRFTEQGKDDPSVPRWSARIVNWWVMIGLGGTKSEAHENLAHCLEAARERRGQLPRPGTGLPIEFAASNQLEQNRELVHRIIEDVLGFDPNGIFVSDGSTLWDFSDEDSITEYQAKIKDLFGKDVSHIESGNLVEIAKYIADDS